MKVTIVITGYFKNKEDEQIAFADLELTLCNWSNEVSTDINYVGIDIKHK